VTGVAALIFSKYSTWSATQVEARLKATAVDLGKKGRDDYYGVGRVDAGRALTAR
jgi:subtilisin family serine protease